MSKVVGACIGCRVLTTVQLTYDVDDEYGIACSEPGVPTFFTVTNFVCEACQAKELQCS